MSKLLNNPIKSLFRVKKTNFVKVNSFARNISIFRRHFYIQIELFYCFDLIAVFSGSKKNYFRYFPQKWFQLLKFEF